MSQRNMSSDEQTVSFENEKQNTKQKNFRKPDYLNKMESTIHDLMCTKINRSDKQQQLLSDQDLEDAREKRFNEIQREMDEILGTGKKSSNKHTKLTENAKCNFKHKKNEQRINEAQMVHKILTSHDSASSLESLASTGTAESDNEEKYENLDDPDIVDTHENSVSNSKTKRQNMTFSSTEVRDIERHNSMLMRRILSYNRRASNYNTTPAPSKISNSAVNRKKQQRQIDHDNLILLRKIQSVKPTGLSRSKQ